MTKTKVERTREQKREEVIKKITSDKKQALGFLVKAGIATKEGKLTEAYK